jgi:hypothetical protein
MRCKLSAMFSQDPPTGVYKGMMPFSKSQQTSAAVLCPARLSSTNSIRSGGSSASSVGLIASPSCHRSQAARQPAAGSAGGAGRPARMAASSRLSQGCRTALGQVVTPCRRTRPSSGRNSVRALAVPARRYSCGSRAGWPSGRHDGPAYGIVW